jgi:hypothetical protein
MTDHYCAGKEGFDSKTKANKIARRMGRRGTRRGRITVYRCTGCGKWHIGQTIILPSDRK